MIRRRHLSTILIVDDDARSRNVLGAILKDDGYELAFAESGAKAIDMALDIVPDLVLLDISLPKMNGIEVCRAIATHEETKSIPVIMLTIHKELSIKLSSYIAGARRFISKPFGVEELIGEVNKTLRQSGIPQQVNNTLFDPRD